MKEVELDDGEALLRLANARMPFGKYAGMLLIDLPEAYVLWFARRASEGDGPGGELGEQLAALVAIKENGLEAMLRPLARR